MEPTSLDSARVLLVQARAGEGMERQELQCFVERCQLRPDQFVQLNVARGGRITPDALDGVDALMIGGAGEYSARLDYPWMADLLALVRTATDADLPTFGTCWGHQVIARALGGTVVFDPERAEFGCGEIELTDAAATDPLMRSFPPTFLANMGHSDRVTLLPDGAIELARNASQPNQAFRVAGKPVYGTQFHSELDAARERERLIAYREHYRTVLGGDEAFQEVLDSLADTTEVDHLMHDFLRIYVARRA